MTYKDTPIDPLQAKDFANIDGIQHGFFSRKGGCSTGLYEGLNVGLGSKDNASDVQENRARVAKWFSLGPDNLVTVHQVHSPDVFVVTSADDLDPYNRPKADAIVTNVPELVLGVLTADCGPVLFADPKNRVIGAAHAGWGGAVNGVLENTIEAMIALGAQVDNIRAVLGPSISGENYEVGPEFVERFVQKRSENAVYFDETSVSKTGGKTGHAMFDLREYTKDRLLSAGVKASIEGPCTYSPQNGYYSYRRSCHKNELDYGRQISAICIKSS